MSSCERIVRKFFDAFFHGEVQRMLAFVAADAVFRPVAPRPGQPEELHGHPQIYKWARWATGRQPIMAARIDEVRTLDEDHVLLDGRARIPEPIGGFADRSAAWLVRVQGGKVTRLDGFLTMDEALAEYEARHVQGRG